MHWISIPDQDGNPRWFNLALVTDVRFYPSGNGVEGLGDYLSITFSGDSDNTVRVNDLPSMAAIRNRLNLLAEQAVIECPRCDGLGVVVNSDDRNEECGQCRGRGVVSR